MSKRQVIILLSIWTMVFLFLGFPFFWDKIIAVFTGLCIVLLAISLQPGAPKLRSSAQSKMDDIKNSRQAAYVEHRGVPGSSNAVKTIISEDITTG
jgi:hypothetical protein